MSKYHSDYYSSLIRNTFKPDGSFATKWASQRVSNVLNLLGEIGSDQFILDLGCGIGTFTSLLSEKAFVVGVDFSRVAMKAAKFIINQYGNKIGAELLRCDVQFLPFRDGVFDTIISADLVEHLDDSQFMNSTLECKRVLKRKGFIAVYTPNLINVLSPNFYLRRGWPFYPEHIGLKSPFSLYLILRKHGFTLTKFYCTRSYHLLIRKIARIIWAFPFILGGRTCIRAQNH